MESAAIGALAGFLTALGGWLIVYTKLARSVLTTRDHDRECDRRMKPINVRIGELKEDMGNRMGELKEDIQRLSVKQDALLSQILSQIKHNGGSK